MDKRTSVLIVEDEEHIRKVLEYNLKLDGFEVFQAADGPAALKLASEKTPDVILLDWMMPDMDGLEVLAELKHNQRTEHIPVFMLTAKGMLSEVGRAFEAGADDYITKPFDPNRLGKIIRKKLDEYARVKST
jgi:two-component system phosphate regulon response regulator PhoB